MPSQITPYILGRREYQLIFTSFISFPLLCCSMFITFNGSTRLAHSTS
uniref:Uncharacterized protein n=1 Tax=Arundo donax TaxID=35708 RepID=A0A0A9HRZ2_ARUDO